MDVRGWLKSIGLEQYETAFLDNAITFQLLPMLTGDDLKDLGIALVGHRRLLLEAAATLRSRNSTTQTDGQTSSFPPDPAMPTRDIRVMAERRPLSVMFCDLIGSTELSSRLDPEDLREVIRAYQFCVAATVQQFGGFIARYVGDGVLIYFGWPQAQETDPERAVRTGLSVAAAVGQMQLNGETLAVRVGIATGLVVVGEPIGSGDSRQQTAFGETPNVAARLQSLAGPNQVMIDQATRRQIGGLFACQEIGLVEMKGLPRPVPVWRVMSEDHTIGQFEALRSRLTPLIGRDEEIELLLRRWTQAKQGRGRVVLVSAEAGVGKSRLAETLAEQIAAEQHTRLRYFCSPHHQDSALYPVIAQIERGAGFVAGDTPAARLVKLQDLLAVTEPSREDMALLAQLHGLSSVAPELPGDLTPERRKEKTLEALLRHLEGLVRQQPVLMIFDDIHWIDPTSCKLLDAVIERALNWPLLLIALCRPDFQPPWTGLPQVTLLSLPRLGREETSALVAKVGNGTVLPDDIVAEIAERADGIPLFVEELTKAVLESKDQLPAQSSAVPHARLSVPATLHASLMARLDRLGPAAKEIAQAGAAIGRDFDYALLVSIVELPEVQIKQALDLLTNANLIFARGAPPAASYLFKHALVQDAAYGCLLRSRRQDLHRRIALALEERFPDIIETQPAVLAQHYQKAGLARQALTYWLKAGQQSVWRSAMVEAVAQLRKGQDVLATLPDDAWRQHQELDLLYAFGSALTATAGFSAAEKANAVARALELAEKLNRPEHLAPLIVGQWAFHMARSEHRRALTLAERIEKHRLLQDDPSAQLLGCFTSGASYFFLGEFDTAHTHLKCCVTRSDAPGRGIKGGVMSTDTYTLSLTFVALSLACLGYLDQARAKMEEAIAEARRLQHAYTLTGVLTHAAWLQCLIGSPMTHLQELTALTSRHQIPHYLGWTLALRGQDLVQQGQTQQGLELIEQGKAQFHAIGSTCYMPLLLMWLAEAYAQHGRLAEEERCILEANKLLEHTDERIVEADLHCRSGDRLLRHGDRVAAEDYYRRGVATAERQNAKLFHLRASIRLTQLWQDQNDYVAARNLLTPVYNWFTEGLDLPILIEARNLLGKLDRRW